jgi:hypothetical protein
MEKHDYETEIRNDLADWLRERAEYEHMTADDFENAAERLQDEAWTADSVTGNGSGSYYCNTWKAEEAICHNLDLLGEALREFGDEGANLLERGAESCDVTIRCYLLGQVFGDVFEKVLGELREKEEAASAGAPAAADA